MKVLVLSYDVPYPPHTGYRSRVFNVVKQLAKEHAVHLVALYDDEAERAACAPAESYCTCVTYLRRQSTSWKHVARSLVSTLPVHVQTIPSALARHLQDVRTREQPDLIYENFAFFSAYTAPLHGCLPVVLDQHNVDRDVWQKLYAHETNPARKAVNYLNWKKTLNLERLAYANVSGVVSVSDGDYRRTQEEIGYDGPHVVGENGVDIDYFSNPSPETFNENEFLFTGTGAYRNRVALHWFLDDIWPLVKRQLPPAKLNVVGNFSAEQIRLFEGAPDVWFSGRVEDVRPYFTSAAVYVAPFQYGYGSKLKILEAMAMQKAIVSTPAGVNGIDVAGGQAVVAPSPQAFADELVALSHDPARIRRLGAAARALACEQYAWDVIGARIRRFICSVAAS